VTFITSDRRGSSVRAEKKAVSGVKRGNIDLAAPVQLVSILGGTIALVLAILQIVETYLDTGEKLRQRRLEWKQKAPDKMRRVK
jgi:hypothetical protein